MSAPKKTRYICAESVVLKSQQHTEKATKDEKIFSTYRPCRSRFISPAPQAADFDRVYETGTPLKAPRAMPNFRELKHALKMPQFDLKTIYGKNVNLADYKGKVVVLNVWATWCRPCVAEIPELITAQNALKKF